jgi:hypothetical protein
MSDLLPMLACLELAELAKEAFARGNTFSFSY